MPLIRTTMRPDLEIEVGDQEYAELRALRLLWQPTEPSPADNNGEPDPQMGSTVLGGESDG